MAAPTGPIVLTDWIERYRRDWETGDSEDLVDLFTPDATYRSSVFTDPHRGTEGIRAYWKRAAGNQRDVTVVMGEPLVTDVRVAVEWWTTMDDPDDGRLTLPGCLLLEFAEDGRCRELWEYWQSRPEHLPPPAGWGGPRR